MQVSWKIMSFWELECACKFVRKFKQLLLFVQLDLVFQIEIAGVLGHSPRSDFKFVWQYEINYSNIHSKGQMLTHVWQIIFILYRFIQIHVKSAKIYRCKSPEIMIFCELECLCKFLRRSKQFLLCVQMDLVFKDWNCKLIREVNNAMQQY